MTRSEQLREAISWFALLLLWALLLALMPRDAAAQTKIDIVQHTSGTVPNSRLASPLVPPGNTDIAGNSLLWQVTNDGTTGTTNKLVAKLSSGNAIKATTGDAKSYALLGVVVSGGATSGSASIAFAGTATCTFDGTATAGHYAALSTTTAGDCTDAGAVLPTDGTLLLGTVAATHSGAGDATVYVFSPQVLLTNTVTGATQTKITYNNLGQVTAGAQAACGDLSNAAASCSSDTTNAANITSGTLPNARIVALPNANLANSTITIGATSTALGGTISAATARGSNGANVEGATGHGDSAYTVLATDRLVYTNAAFTASRTWTLPAANAVNVGGTICFSDRKGTLTTTNTLVISRAGSDTINDAGTAVTFSAANDGGCFQSDGTSVWIYNSAATSVANGGTGDATLTSHGVLVGAGTSPVTALTACGANTFVAGAASADPTCRAVDVSTADVTGVLAAARHPALTGDVTTPSGSVATTIAASAVTSSKVDSTVKGYALANTSSNAMASAVTDTKLLEISLTAGEINVANKVIHIHASGTWTTGTTQTPTWNFKFKLCTISGCGSGTAITLTTWTSAASTASTTQTWIVDADCPITTTGSSGTLLCHGTADLAVGASANTAFAGFHDVNTANTSTIDLTAALFLDVMANVSTQSGTKNSCTAHTFKMTP